MAGFILVLLSGCAPNSNLQDRNPEARLYESTLHRYKKVLYARAQDDEQEKALYSVLKRDGETHTELIFSEIRRSERNIPYSMHLYALLMEIGTSEAVGFVLEAHSQAEKPADRWFYHKLLELYFRQKVPKGGHEKAVSHFRKLYLDKYK